MLQELETDIFNDPKRFESFFKAKYAPLCHYANKYVLDIDTAEEIVQDIFVKIWERRGKINISGSELAYVTKSIKNACLNHIKHRKIVLVYEQAEASKGASESIEMENEAFDVDLETAALQAIEELPPQRKKIFSMSRIDGLKYREIAEQMGLSIKTVEVQMGLSLKYLRNRLKNYLDHTNDDSP
jgi:RNA polymerase sigma-70 factor (ECF subfamily)